ncbi:MAG: OmpP1/FadL family transporter, partial [Desulfovibrionales bacterium]
MFRRILPALVLCLLFVASDCRTSMGAGFALYEWGARGLGMGGTLVARADDPSAIAFNPAGITQLEGIHTVAGITGVGPNVDVTASGMEGTTTTQGKENIWYPPHAYLTYQMTDRYWFGLGVMSRFGLGTEFDEDWIGRYNVYETHIQSVSVLP